MNSNRLTLRKLNSNFTGFPDVTIGSVLSHEELDNNFLYLKGEVIHDANIDVNSNLILEKINGNNIVLPLSGVTITGITTDTFVTSGTYNNNSINFTNNQGGSFTVSGIEDNNVFATGLTYNQSNDTLSLFNNDNSVINASGFSSNFIDNNEFLTGGTVDINSGNVTFTTNSGSTFQVTGFDQLDTFVTGGTYNGTNKTITFNNNKSGSFDVTIEDNNDNEFTTGGTLDLNSGIITFTTNSGSTYDVDGFSSLNDTTITGGTFNPQTEILTLSNNINNDIIITGFTTQPTGLEAIDEGNGIGWRLIGRNSANYGNVGLNAIDLSTSNVSLTPKGALGENSFAQGLNTVGLGENSFAGGNNTLADGINAMAFGNSSVASGDNSLSFGENSLAQGLRSFAGGISAQSLGNFSFGFGNGAQATADGSVAFGSAISTNNYSIGLGRGLYSRYNSETVVGRFNIDNGFINPTSPDGPESKVFTVGNGTNNVNRNDAFIIFNNGAALFDPINLTNVNNGKMGMYAYDSVDNVPKYHDGTEWKLFGTTGGTDTVVTGGSYNINTNTITFSNNQGGSFDVTGITTNSLTVIEGYEELFASGGEITMTLPNEPQLGRHFQLFRNGQLELFGINNEYDITNNTITFNNPLSNGEIIQFYYKYITT